MTKETAAFGAALRATMDAPVTQISNVVSECSAPIIINLTAPVTFDMIQTREDMLVLTPRRDMCCRQNICLIHIPQFTLVQL